MHPRQELWPGAYRAVRVQSSRDTGLGLWAQPCSHSTPRSQICSLMRGGIAERGGIRVGHRIIEINGQSVVATPHEKIIQILTEAVSEVSWAPVEPLGSQLCTSTLQPRLASLICASLPRYTSRPCRPPRTVC